MQQTPIISQSDAPNPVTTPPSHLPPKPPKKSHSEGWRSALSTIAILIAAPLVAIFLTSFIFQSYEVDGPSMETTLQNRDRLIVWKVPHTMARLTDKNYIPSRGTIIVFVKRGISNFGEPDDKQLIKRVIGLPGERLVVNDGAITIYNKEHPEGFNPDTSGIYQKQEQLTAGNIDITVPQGEVFVCGDNRSNSLDSRAFGAISSKDIVGELTFRIFPFNKVKSY